MSIPTSKKSSSNQDHTQTQVTEPPASGSASAQPEDRAPQSAASATPGEPAWKTPRDMSTLEMVFPASVLHLMPPYEAIPIEFKRWPGNTKWSRLTSDLFYFGVSKLELLVREGVDEKAAMRTLRAILGSFEPKHEHKEAAVAYLMSLWFEDADWTKGNGR